MIVLEFSLLILTYTLLIIAIFLEVICYSRKLETIETIFFTASLLLMVTAFTVRPIFITADQTDAGWVITLFPMIVVGIATILNTLSERVHRLPTWVKPISIALASGLSLATIAAYVTNMPHLVEYVVPAFLAIAVVGSMILVQLSKPTRRIAHLEKSERIFSKAFLVAVPLTLLSSFVFVELGYNLQLGFTIPVLFSLLAANKIWDDLQRLSLVNPTIEPIEQHFKNFLLTEREKEIAIVLSKGHSYKKISEDLFISMPTVKTHASNIYKKCEVKNRAELMLLLVS